MCARWKRRFTRERACSSSETNYSKRTLEQQSEEVVYKQYVRAHARTFSRSSRSDAPEKKEWSPSSFQKLQFRVFEPKRRSKVTSVYRKTSNASTSSGFHRERERLNPSLVASHHCYIIVCVVFKQKHRLNTRKEQSI